MKTRERAQALAESMLDLGLRAGRRVVCEVTAMDEPLGSAVGNAVEVREALADAAGRWPRRLHGARSALRDPVARPLGVRCRRGGGPTARRARDYLGGGRRGLRALGRGAGRRSRRAGAAAGSGDAHRRVRAATVSSPGSARSASAAPRLISEPAGCARTIQSTTRRVSCAWPSAAPRSRSDSRSRRCTPATSRQRRRRSPRLPRATRSAPEPPEPAPLVLEVLS